MVDPHESEWVQIGPNSWLVPLSISRAIQAETDKLRAVERAVEAWENEGGEVSEGE